MNTVKLLCGAALLAFAASCSQDEMELSKIATSNTISYKVDAGKMTRATSAYENGTDISTFNVSAWIVAPKKDDDGNFILDENGKYTFALPGYTSPNTGNAAYFTNDVLTRTGVGTNGTSGTFNYQSDARYWPNNDEILDFFALVDNDKLGAFSFNVDGKPGVDGTIKQGGLNDMPDMLYSVAFNQTAGHKQAQQNVSFHFDHAFAQVVVTAEIKNKNLHVVITDLEIHGIREEGKFYMPYKSGEGLNTVFNPASWVATDKYTDIKNLMKNEGKNPVVLDVNGKTKDFLSSDGDVKNQILMIPGSYSGRNGSSCQTYIQLKGYAYNKAGSELDEDTDALIYGNLEKNGSVTPLIMKIPIEFNWAMGTINKYNIIFDCGNGGQTDPSDNPDDPNKPAFMRIGYEVEVNDWTDVDHGDYEYPNNVKH